MRRASILLGFLTACAGKAPPAANNVDAPPGSTDGSSDTGQNVTGFVMDYFGGVQLSEAGVASDGIAPPVSTTSAMDGSYGMTVPVGSKFFLITSRASYLPTRNVPLSMADAAIMQDVYVLSEVDVRRQHVTANGQVPAPGTAFLEADLQAPDGTPVEGIPTTNVQLLDALNQPVTGVLGPYFFGVTGDIDPAATTSTAYGTPPKVRVAFLDVPPGTYTLAVTRPGGAGNVQDNTLVQVAADSATLAVSGQAAPTSSATDPHFATDIYPKLQKAANGGLGCANCHTPGGPGSVLIYDDPPTMVLAHMMAATGVIDLTTPANSLLVKNPLYPPTNHPNATFLDVNDPNYQLFLLWITNGAKP